MKSIDESNMKSLEFKPDRKLRDYIKEAEFDLFGTTEKLKVVAQLGQFPNRDELLKVIQLSDEIQSGWEARSGEKFCRKRPHADEQDSSEFASDVYRNIYRRDFDADTGGPRFIPELAHYLGIDEAIVLIQLEWWADNAGKGGFSFVDLLNDFTHLSPKDLAGILTHLHVNHLVLFEQSLLWPPFDTKIPYRIVYEELEHLAFFRWHVGDLYVRNSEPSKSGSLLEEEGLPF